ncbi:hypothetical protein FRB95_001618 [Tulasnella sp. JGI-2019a]|nr:hypothetical protein FRB93_010580 [Tulasnella sp. JGI-2019a]KAG9032297.1 hypothetical protein FRB95_001618 [Tulasnella sp. JGI-2019a]
MTSRIQAPQGERFPVLWMFIQLVEQLAPIRYQRFLQALRALQGVVHRPDRVDADEVHEHFDAVRSEYHGLQQLGLWGIVDEQIQAFIHLVVEIMNAFPTPVQRGNPFRKGLVAVGGAALVTVGAVVVLPAIAVGGLGLLGFSAAGPVAGSIAAMIQSTCYGGAVASGSAFALAQSAAMGGIAVGTAAEVVAGAFAVTAGARILHNAANGEDDATDREIDTVNGEDNGEVDRFNWEVDMATREDDAANEGANEGP